MGIRAPRHLSALSKRFYRRLVAEYSIDDISGLRVLRQACECLDLIEETRREISKQGLVIRDRFNQPRANPLLSTQRDARAGFLAALKMLGLAAEAQEVER